MFTYSFIQQIYVELVPNYEAAVALMPGTEVMLCMVWWAASEGSKV